MTKPKEWYVEIRRPSGKVRIGIAVEKAKPHHIAAFEELEVLAVQMLVAKPDGSNA